MQQRFVDPQRYHPSVWGNHFINLSQDHQKLDAWAARANELREEVRGMLKDAKGSAQDMELIDNMQRLGVAYHFDKEIQNVLTLIYSSNRLSSETNLDLHSTALRFRLLRQWGYRVSSDIFSKFKDQEGKFKETLMKTDPKGTLSLYEAAFLRIHEDTILDEALAFTKKQLTSAMEHLEPPLAALVRHSLVLPLRKRMHRLESKDYYSLYEMQDGHSHKLLELAKLNYNLLQSLHQKEMAEISRWWKELDIIGKLSFARDRAVECVFWPIGVYYEPEHSRARVFTTKVMAITSVIDDIYDVHGTIDELQLFTDAVQKWDLAEMDRLPDYMKVCYRALLDTMKAMEEELAPEGNSCRIPYLIETFKTLCREYFVEARWCNDGFVPPLEEYMQSSLVTCGYPMIFTLSFVAMGDEIPEELFKWLASEPKMADSTSRLCRIVDDMASTEFEQKRGHVASAVQCYMEHPSSSEEEARQKLREIVEFHWKDVNEGCLEPAPVPIPLLQRIVNLSRVMEVMYLYGDGYTFSNTFTKERISAMFVDAIPI